MIGYTMVGTADLPRSIAFYAPLFAAIGIEECWHDEHTVSWGRPDDETFPRFITGYPFNGEPATVGNGTMTAFSFSEAAMVDRLHALALAHGGSDEGRPGLRPQYGEGFYAGYVRDPDGNKLAFVCYDAKSETGST